MNKEEMYYEKIKEYCDKEDIDSLISIYYKIKLEKELNFKKDLLLFYSDVFIPLIGKYFKKDKSFNYE